MAKNANVQKCTFDMIEYEYVHQKLPFCFLTNYYCIAIALPVSNGCRLWMIVGQASNLPDWCSITEAIAFDYIVGCGPPWWRNDKQLRLLQLVTQIAPLSRAWSTVLSLNWVLVLSVNLHDSLQYSQQRGFQNFIDIMSKMKLFHRCYHLLFKCLKVHHSK